MPGIFDTPMSRRRFLLASAAISGTLPATARRALAEQSLRPARLALLSDTHIPAVAPNGYRGFVPADNLAKVVGQVQSSDPQAAILNGDAARLTGEREDYVVLKKLLGPVAENTPVHIGMGNHDDRVNFFKVFPQGQDRKELVAAKHVSVFELGGTRFVVLDSLLYVNKVAGLLGKLQREWLAKFLQQSDDRPVVFFVHHTLGDNDGDLLDFDKVFEVMRQYRQVKAVFYGHSHSYRIDQREHVYLINQPAIGYNFSDAEPVGWLDASFTSKGVELTLNAIGGNIENDGKTTGVVWE